MYTLYSIYIHIWKIDINERKETKMYARRYMKCEYHKGVYFGCAWAWTWIGGCDYCMQVKRKEEDSFMRVRIRVSLYRYCFSHTTRVYITNAYITSTRATPIHTHARTHTNIYYIYIYKLIRTHTHTQTKTQKQTNTRNKRCKVRFYVQFGTGLINETCARKRVV